MVAVNEWTPRPVLELLGVSRVMDGETILAALDWVVREGERWVVLGPNGSGKSTLLKVAALYLHPSTGTVRVLDGELGRVDVRRHRTRIGYASAGMADLLRGDLVARDIVKTAKFAALEPWWHTYGPEDEERADALLARLGCGSLASHRFSTLSSGERQRVLLARALMTDPGIVLLDEPTAALDLAGREHLVATLAELAADPTTPPLVLVTHHLEEIPPGFTHALVVTRDGAEGGPLTEVLTAARLSRAFGVAVEVGTERGRWWARATGRAW